MASSPLVRWLFDIDADDVGPDELVDDGFFAKDNIWPAVRYAALHWASLAKPHSSKVHDKALWRLKSEPIWVGFYIQDSDVPMDERVQMVEALKHITLAIPEVHGPREPMETGYYMLWHTVGKACNASETADACFEVLKELLWNLDERIQYSALHGLGHLNHPSRPALVSEFIQRADSKLSQEERTWLQECRDGTVM